LAPQSECHARPVAPKVESERGAVQAAIAYLGALGWKVITDDVRRRDVIARRATPEAVQPLDAQLAEPAAAVRAVAELPVIARRAVLGYRVDAFSGSQATVSIWGMALFATGVYDATTQWSTSRISLVWSSGRWLVSDVKSTGGPSPDTPLRALAAADRGFKELRHVP
jgi:hypothetical protein